MPDIYGLMTNTRLRLGDPSAQRPNDMQLLNAVCTNLRTIKRHQRNTSNAWSFNEVQIDITPQVATYRINVSDFGTPLAVITYAPQLATWVPRIVPFFQPQNLEFDWGLQQNAAWSVVPFDGSNCTALRCAFYWRDGVPYVQFAPLPQTGCAYLVKFLASANGVNDAALTETLVTNEDADLVECRSAMSLLSTTEWMASNTKDGRSYNAERRSDLARTLSNDEQELKRQFEAAQLIVSGPHMSRRVGTAIDYSG